MKTSLEIQSFDVYGPIYMFQLETCTLSPRSKVMDPLFQVAAMEDAAAAARACADSLPLLAAMASALAAAIHASHAGAVAGSAGDLTRNGIKHGPTAPRHK